MNGMKSFFYMLIAMFNCQVFFSQSWQNMIPKYSFENVTNDYPRNDHNPPDMTCPTSSWSEHRDSSFFESKNKLFVEFLGGGGYYSLGFEQDVLRKNNFKLQWSIALSHRGWSKPSFSFGFPISINSRFSFWNFNGVDIGLSLGNYFNYWAFKDMELYFDCPLGYCEKKIRLLPSVHLGWVFNLKRVSISPRFYLFYFIGNEFETVPYMGLRITYKLSKR